MRITDVTTTDIYATFQTVRPIRIIQLGPQSGGRFWKNQPFTSDECLPSEATRQYSQAGYTSPSHGHLAVTQVGINIDRDGAIEALSALVLPDWTGDDAQDTQLAKTFQEGLPADLLRMVVASSKRLTLWSDYLAGIEADRKRYREAEERAVRRQTEAAAVLDEVTPVLRAAGMTDMQIEGLRMAGAYDLNNKVQVPLAVLLYMTRQIQKGRQY